MITSIHTLIYSDDAPATRAFLRDVLGWPSVEDAGGGGAGWLIFKSGPSEMGVHPTSSVYDGKTYESPRHHLISLMCDDIGKLHPRGESGAPRVSIRTRSRRDPCDRCHLC
jgi:catechol 2,3-dioxygenase-like lactoylglutathione lyase family enzyme